MDNCIKKSNCLDIGRINLIRKDKNKNLIYMRNNEIKKRFLEIKDQYKNIYEAIDILSKEFYLSEIAIRVILRKDKWEYDDEKEKEVKNYVYLIQNTTWSDWVKVGVTSDITSRLKHYQVSTPHKDFQIIYKIEVDDKFSSEKIAKDKLKDVAKSTKNEWFEVDHDLAVNILDTCFKEN